MAVGHLKKGQWRFDILGLVFMVMFASNVKADEDGKPKAARTNATMPNADSPALAPRLAALQQAISQNQAKALVPFLHFPLHVMVRNPQGQLVASQIENSQQFVDNFSTLFGFSQQQFLRCVGAATLTFDGFDYSALDGQFWLRDFNKNGRRDLYISTLSADAATLQPWLTKHCAVQDELPVASDAVTEVKVGNIQAQQLPALGFFSGRSEQHRFEIAEISPKKWRYRSWLLASSELKPALEITGAVVLSTQPILQFKRGKYRYRFIAATEGNVHQLEIYYLDKLLRTETIKVD